MGQPDGHFRVLGGNNRPIAWASPVARNLWFSLSATFLSVHILSPLSYMPYPVFLLLLSTVQAMRHCVVVLPFLVLAIGLFHIL
jgi:hypothetical protein